jgi:hypothetical protein
VTQAAWLGLAVGRAAWGRRAASTQRLLMEKSMAEPRRRAAVREAGDGLINRPRLGFQGCGRASEGARSKSSGRSM